MDGRCREFLSERVPDRHAGSSEPSSENAPHRGDWIGFLIWVGCFVLMAAMQLAEMITGLMGW